MYMFILRPVKHPHGYSAFSEWKNKHLIEQKSYGPIELGNFTSKSSSVLKIACHENTRMFVTSDMSNTNVLRKCFSITMSMLDNSHTLCSKPHPWQGLILWKLSVLVNSTWRPGIGIRLNAAQGNHLSRFRGCLSRSNIQSCDRVFRTSRFKNQNL